MNTTTKQAPVLTMHHLTGTRRVLVVARRRPLRLWTYVPKVQPES